MSSSSIDGGCLAPYTSSSSSSSITAIASSSPPPPPPPPAAAAAAAGPLIREHPPQHRWRRNSNRNRSHSHRSSSSSLSMTMTMTMTMSPPNTTTSTLPTPISGLACPHGSVGQCNDTKPSTKPINCNLDSFLDATSLIVRAQHLPRSCQWEACGKRSQRNAGNVEQDDLPYFILGDLWESFDEWSAYGVGVPITLKDQDVVVQYYVPYLSAIQLYTRTMKRQNIKRSITGGSVVTNNEDTDELSSVPDCRQCQCGTATSQCCTSESSEASCCGCYAFEKMSQSDLRKDPEDNDNTTSSYSSHGSRTRDWHGHLLFEFFESSPPYARVPFSDKISQISANFTALKTLRSVDLLPASWMSIAWYPIYRIPIGPTLRDLEACFLSFHSLSTSLQDGEPWGIVKPSSRPIQCATSLEPGSQWEHPMIKLEAFGLAHYKLRGSIWTSAGNLERRHAASMYRCAESWLKQLHVGHPDFEFFRSHNPSPQAS